jgi:hypothetical protein
MATISKGRSRWGGVYSDCVSNALIYLGVESALSSEKSLKSLMIRVDFDCTTGEFESFRSERRSRLSHSKRGQWRLKWPPSANVGIGGPGFGHILDEARDFGPVCGQESESI